MTESRPTSIPDGWYPIGFHGEYWYTIKTEHGEHRVPVHNLDIHDCDVKDNALVYQLKDDPIVYKVLCGSGTQMHTAYVELTALVSQRDGGVDQRGRKLMEEIAAGQVVVKVVTGKQIAERESLMNTEETNQTQEKPGANLNAAPSWLYNFQAYEAEYCDNFRGQLIIDVREIVNLRLVEDHKVHGNYIGIRYKNGQDTTYDISLQKPRRRIYAELLDLVRQYETVSRGITIEFSDRMSHTYTVNSTSVDAVMTQTKPPSADYPDGEFILYYHIKGMSAPIQVHMSDFQALKKAADQLRLGMTWHRSLT